jgi:hypothetical protein
MVMMLSYPARHEAIRCRRLPAITRLIGRVMSKQVPGETHELRQVELVAVGHRYAVRRALLFSRIVAMNSGSLR